MSNELYRLVIFCTFVMIILINDMYDAGCGYSKPLLIPGGRAFIWPGIQQLQRYNLSRII